MFHSPAKSWIRTNSIASLALIGSLALVVLVPSAAPAFSNDGASWADCSIPSVTTDYYTLDTDSSGLSSFCAWVAGANGEVKRQPFDTHGTGPRADGWSAYQTGQPSGVNSIDMADPRNGWAVHENGQICVTSDGGVSWENASYDSGEHYYDVFSLDDTHAWAVGSGGTVISWDGTAWSTEAIGPPGPTGDMNGVFALDEDNIWVVGERGQIWHYEAPEGWTDESLPGGAAAPDLFAVYAADSGNVFAVGEGGTVARYQGEWTTSSITPARLEGITGVDASHAWACDDAGGIWAFGGGAWSREESGTTKALHDIRAVNSTNVWAVGDQGTILYRDYTAPRVSSVTPASGANDGIVRITDLAGSNFRPGATVELRGQGQQDISASSVNVVNDKKITCEFNLGGKTVGDRDVVVTNTDGKGGAKAGAFRVTQAQKHTWYLAEGSTAWGFETYVSIVNPNTSAVNCDVTFMVDGGGNRRISVPMPATSRATVFPSDILGRKDFSTKVVCREGKTICADRTMMWPVEYDESRIPPKSFDLDRFEAHSSVGVTAPATTWYLPEGSSAWGFECWVLVQNPNPRTATVTLTYMPEGAEVVTVDKEVPPNSRASFNMADDIGLKDASIKVTCDLPVVPERAMYRNDRTEGHDSIGATAPATSYYLAEGSTAWGFTTFVLLQNPGTTHNTVTITYMTPHGPVTHPPFTMDPNSRRTVRVNDVLQTEDFSTRVDGSHPLIAERAMYWDPGTGEACHDSIGMPSAHTCFYLPDGGADPDAETWTLVQNPNGMDVRIEVKYMSGTGTVVTKTDVVAANSRKTYNMKEDGAVGSNSITVRSLSAGRKIMVERAIYFFDRSGGTDTIGGFTD